MKNLKLSISIIVTLILIIGCSEIKTDTTPQTDSRVGNIEFENDYPTEETAEKLREELKFQAAVQTYLWSFPLANVMSLRDGHRKVGITNTMIPIFENLLTPNTVVPTGNQTTVYAYNITTLGDQPMVIVVPPDVVGFVADAWQRPQGDLGRPGEDRGKGGKYLLIPPGYQGKLPSSGYYHIQAATKNIFWLVRGFIYDGDTEATVNNLKLTKMYPLSRPNTPQEYVNASKMPAYCIPPRGTAYYDLIAKALNEETVQERDRIMMGMATMLGIEKGLDYKPNLEMLKILEEAEKVAFATQATLSLKSVASTAPAYPGTDSKWEFCFQTQSPSFDDEHHLELYERAAFVHQAMTGAFAMVLNLRGKGSKYIFTSRDTNGIHLDGSKSYKLNVPPNVPAKDFWSICVYDVKTRSIINTGRPMSAINSNMDLSVNENGSIDLYFGPTPPPSGEQNWIKTKPGEGFFMYLRLYGPLEPFYDKSWMMNNVELSK